MRVTTHAQYRMLERNIRALDVAHVLRYGKKYENRHDNTKYTFIDTALNVYVVTDKAMTTVITVFRKER